MKQAHVPDWKWFIGALVLAALVLANLPAQAEQTGADGAMVTMVNRIFQPFALTVDDGQMVIWTNADGEPHTIIADNGSFATGYIGAGQQFSYSFEQPGRYTYYCDIHQGMEGEITVRSRLFLPVITKETGEQL
jgi:plastocyanin